MTVRLDFKASASASHRKAGCRNCRLQRPRGQCPGLGTLVPDHVETEVDVGDRTVGLQSICKYLSDETPGRAHRLRLGF